MKLLKPDLLKKLLQHGKPVTLAIDMLNSKWDRVIARYGLRTKINASTVIIAKNLVQAGLFKNHLNFRNYGAVKKYLVQNDVYMSNSGRQELLRPFRE